MEINKHTRTLALALLVCLYACQAPVPQKEDSDTLFTLLTPQQTGIAFKNTVVEDEKHNHLINDMIVAGAGVGIADINNDSLPDIYFAGNQVPDRLYLNKGNLQFEDISKQAGIFDDQRWSTGVTMADVNNDGYIDIYVCRSVQENPQLSQNLLYINNGDLTFTEQGSAYGLSDRGFSVQATFFDADKDGLLDMYLVNQPPSLGKRSGEVPKFLNAQTMIYSDRFYWNTGKGKFKDVTQEAGLLNLAYGLSATVGDFNNDSWPDIYVCNDFDRPDHLYINQGDGTYTNRINQAVKHISNFSMGSDAADYDNDGYLDLMVVDMVAEDNKSIKTNMGGMSPQSFWNIVNSGWHYQYMFNTLQRNNGNGTFSEVAHLGGVSNTDWSWGPLWADFDNDGWKDLVVTNGITRNQRHSDLNKLISHRLDSLEYLAQSQGKELKEIIDVMEFVDMAPAIKVANYAFKNNGDMTFTKKVKEWGFDLPTFSFGSAYADLDKDGDLDLVINNVDDFAFVYRNNSSGPDANFLRINPVNDQGSQVVGARVKLFHKGELWQIAEQGNARGYMSKSEDWLHFGLGSHDRIDSIAIVWPDLTFQSLVNVTANQFMRVTKDPEAPQIPQPEMQTPLFAEITEQLDLIHKHQENSYNDYQKEILLPHKMSNYGPGLATGDVNGDGRDDFYIGGAAGFPGSLYLQQASGSFRSVQQDFWIAESAYEDIAAQLFDADNDGDQDLYVVSGGNEFDGNSPLLQDRLYLNNGRGNFSTSLESLPEMLTSGGCVEPYDYDQDGDLDLFVGGRLVVGRYPVPASSHILENENGTFKDVTAEIAPGLQQLGLVTSAVWTDYNNDQAVDLVLVGEWMPVTIFENQNGSYQNITGNTALASQTGWFYDVIAEDFDGDGDQDLVAGNLGLNYKYKASAEEPFEVFYDDFDDNGSYDIVLSYYEHGETYPVRGRSCSSEQVPQIAEDFPTYEAFGDASLREIYGESLDQAVHYQAVNFASCYLENLGNGNFKITPLPQLAQLSNINNIIAHDFDGDENLDLLISGNLYASEIETPRNDAGMGLYLKGDGSGDFQAVPLIESGFFAPHDAKDMKLIRVGPDKTPLVLVANNQFYLQAIAVQSKAM